MLADKARHLRLSVGCLFLGALALAGCSRQQATASVSIEDHQFTVEGVCSETARQRGLSGRLALAAGQGMLFVFPASARHRIWMKDMHFPIDILWIDKSGTVVHVQAEATPDSYPAIFAPPVAAQYVLEIPAGSGIRRHAIVAMHNIPSGPPRCR